MLKVNGIIRTCRKASLFSAFRRFGFERRQPSCNLNNQKSSENPSLSGRRIFTERIFGQPRHKTQQILGGFASILTTGERKSSRENHGSDYSIHLNPKEKCAVFLDIDGTLIHDSFAIPQPNLDAIAAARAKGHMVFINTGRSWGNIPQELRRQFDLDGVIAGSGAMVMIGSEEVYTSCIDTETALSVADYFFNDRSCWCVFEGYNTNYIIANAGYKVREGRQTEIKNREEFARLLLGDVIQVIAAGEKVPDDFTARFGDKMTFYGMRTYTDCVLKGNSKAAGMQKVLEITGIKRENTIAIGDSSNDLAMLEFAGVSVAMANSQQHILDMADYITSSSAESGVAKAINELLELQNSVFD